MHTQIIKERQRKRQICRIHRAVLYIFILYIVYIYGRIISSKKEKVRKFEKYYHMQI